MNFKNHKFFEKYLDNDLEDLYDFLEKKDIDLRNGNIFDLSILNSKHNLKNESEFATKFSNYYNIFDFDYNPINKLFFNLIDIVKNICEYYDSDFYSQEYYIHGWFNFDDAKSNKFEGIPSEKTHYFHDHLGGEGFPHLHGYYCVNAEPSTTYYKINKNTLFNNININNRLIVSETGHPHAKADWYEKNKKRVTIAYDISPKLMINYDPKFSHNIWKPLI